MDRALDGLSGVLQHHVLVAEKDGALIGLTHFVFHRHGWKIEDVCYLQDLYVSPAARGTGCGRKLIEAVYAAADAKGCPSVYWLTQDQVPTPGVTRKLR